MVDKLEAGYCNKCGFVGVPDGMGFHARPSDGEQCNYLCRRATPANGEQVERADEEDIDELDGFLAAYAGEPDGDLVNRIENDDLLTWGILRRLLTTVRSTPMAVIRSASALGNKETDRHG